ncbi:MAG: alpha/beta fold hydrolase [Chloroflexi bacterium]|nr:alpha/beta fold hydrolase [Chloroflexota bacterium]
MSSDRPDTIVLIHGLWMSPLSWEHWVARYSAAGYQVLAPAWPGMEGTVEQLRADTSSYDGIGMTDVIDHYADIIDKLQSPPIMMGHSFGGAFTEVLLDRGLGAAGVAIDPAPVKGVLSLPLSTLRSAFPVLDNPIANRHKAVMLSPSEFHFAFTNTLTDAESEAAYQRYAVPGPGRILFQGALANFNPHAATRVDFHNPDRAPLLVIGGGADHIVPPSVSKEAADRFGKSSSVTEYKEFAGRSHFTVGEPGWEAVADYALAWAAQHARTALPSG